MQRKTVILLLLLLLALPLLSGCSGVIEERPQAELDPSEIRAGRDAPETDETVPYSRLCTLYFINGNGTKLIPVTRELTFDAIGGEAGILLNALLSGPPESEKDASWPAGITARGASVQVSDRFAAVDLPGAYRQLTPDMLYAVRQAVAETFFAAGMRSVQVLVGGREEGADLAGTMPVGTFLPGGSADPEAQLSLLEDERQSREAFARSATLFFPSRDGELLVPVQRSVTCESASAVACLYAILEELGRSPSNALAGEETPAPLDYMEEMPDIARAQDGASRVIRLRFTAALDTALRKAGISRALYLGMLTRTLMGFVPGVDGLAVGIGGENIREVRSAAGDAVAFRDGILTIRGFAGFLAAPAGIYARGEKEGSLKKKQVLLPSGMEENPREIFARMTELPAGESALPPETGVFDLLAFRRERENMVLDFSEAFFERLSSLGEAGASLAVYAIVNSMTEGNGLTGCVFFFGGEQKDGIGNLVLRGRMVRNPGKVEP